MTDKAREEIKRIDKTVERIDKILEDRKTMTVTDVKEYIEFELYVTRRYNQDGVPVIVYQDNMQHILSMLNELEDRPKANWIKQDYSTGYSEYGTASICSKCGSEVISKTNYCSNCGAKMNDELRENRNE